MKKILMALIAAGILAAGCCAMAEDGQFYQTYVDGNRLVREEYALEDGTLYVGENGFARHILKYDENGKAVREEYLDAELKPINNAKGYALVERTWDADGRMTWIRYSDAEGKPVQIDGAAEKA